MINGPLFTIGKFSVWPYGLCMGIGIILCFVFLMLTMTKKNFNEESIDKILFIGIFATAFGVFMASVVQGLYNYIDGKGFDLKSMTFYGGLIGGVSSFVIVWNLYIFVIAPRTKIKALQNNMNASLSDALPFIPIGITIAHAFGRLGCTMYGCCHGGETDAWYGILMYSGNDFATKVVPTQLFECIFLAVLSLVMALLYFKFKFNYNFSLYCIAYGIWRFVIEYVRTDDRGSFIPGLTPSQFWSIIIVILGIGFIFLQKYLLSRFMKHPELQPPVREKKVKAEAVVNGSTPVHVSENYVPEERMAEGDVKGERSEGKSSEKEEQSEELPDNDKQ
ncbi:MAG: prolipoprotein diacylglyceryl transferase [Candidatus Coproplasma sp.]